MNRREFCWTLSAAGLGAATPGLARQLRRSAGPVRFEVFGQGPTIMLGPPVMLHRDGPLAAQLDQMRTGYLERLTDRYRVIVMEYPPVGPDLPPADEFTSDRVCADLLGVADAAGAGRFAWWGFSWGGVIGLQLAGRTDRLTALVCGGWPPLGGAYPAMVGMADSIASQSNPELAASGRLYANFYRSLESWNEQDAVSRLAGPRMTFAGREDVVVAYGQTASIGPTIADRREELERLGWTVRLVDGYKHDLVSHPDVVVPLVREFLDPILLRG